MARGWESKSVEEGQISAAAAAAARVSQAQQQLSGEQLAYQRKKESLLLERVRVTHDLESARNPRYQQMLKLALAHLDQKLAEL